MADFLTGITATTSAASVATITATSSGTSSSAVSANSSGSGSVGVSATNSNVSGIALQASANGGGIGLTAMTGSTTNPAGSFSNTNSSAGPALIVKTSNTTNNGDVIKVQDSTPTTQLTIKQSGAILYATATFPSSPATNDSYYHNTYRAWFTYTGATDGWQQTSVGTFASSFPTVAAGESAKKVRVFRLDRGLEYYYDGTRWLTSILFNVAMPFYTEELGSTSWPISPVTATQNTLHQIERPDASAQDIFIVEASVFSLVQTTLDTTNRWTVELQRQSNAGTYTTIGSVRNLFLDDDGSTTRLPNVRYLSIIDMGGGVQITKANGFAFALKWTKVVSPGGLYTLPAFMKYRMVG